MEAAIAARRAVLDGSPKNLVFFFPTMNSDGAGMSGTSTLAKVCDHGRCRNEARGFQRYEFRVTRSQSDAVKSTGCHSASLASALTAAAAMALPPLRPLTIA